MLKKLGAGLLYAAAAIGVSHLVQSTRAGASYGLDLLIFALLINLIKYPFFKVAPIYSNHSHKSMLRGYFELGHFPFYIVGLITLLTMFIIEGAIVAVTVGIIQAISGIDTFFALQCFILLVVMALFLRLGQFKAFDQFIKVIVFLLTLSTLMATLLASFSSHTDWGYLITTRTFDFGNLKDIAFFMAFVGWMPAPFDVPLWHSLWTIEEQKKNPHKDRALSLKDELFDFKLGFIVTTITAVLFLLLGALVMFQKKAVFSASAAKFAADFINMYTELLGNWSYPLVAIAALTTMFSTALTCLDAFSRVSADFGQILYETRVKAKNVKYFDFFHKITRYNSMLFILTIGSTALIGIFLTSLKAFVDFATITSFVVAPIFAYYSLQIIKKVHRENSSAMTVIDVRWAQVSGAIITLFTLFFIGMKILG